MTITFRGGRLPNDASKPRLKLSHYLTGAAVPAPPAAVDWDAKVRDWPMYSNDQYGCCVWSMIGHAVQAWTANASTEVDVSNAAILKGYSDVTGFDPADPSTDQGTVIQDALNYWRKTGVGGHRILAFAQVDVANETEMQQACALFGVVLFGMNFPRAAMQQFDAGEPWDVLYQDGGIEGGHAILGARYDEPTNKWYVITWGREQPVTFSFLRTYFEEAWAAVSRDWVSSNGSTPSGLDLAAFGAEFTALTGEPSPFTDTPPAPPPRHGSLDVAVQALIRSEDVAAWLRAKHSGLPKKVAALVRAIVDAA